MDNAVRFYPSEYGTMRALRLTPFMRKQVARMVPQNTLRRYIIQFDRVNYYRISKGVYIK
jgi:hypothetical protein